MELLLKRERYKSRLEGTRYELFAKFELQPDEEAIINKSDLRNRMIWGGDPLFNKGKRKTARILGGVAAFIFWVALMATIGDLTGGQTHAWVVIFAIPVGWYVSKFLYNFNREEFTVKDLLAGRTLVGGEELLRMQEQSIREAALKIKEHLDAWKSGGEWDSSERIAL
jgi:hypothetical protein